MQANSSNTTAKQLQDALIRRNDKALMRRKEVEQLTTLSRSQIYALIKSGLFPKQINLGTHSVAWCAQEVNDWIESKLNSRNTEAAV